jgi:hypothetical protein
VLKTGVFERLNWGGVRAKRDVCLFFCVLDVKKREWIMEVKQNKTQVVSTVYNEMSCFVLREISVYVGTTKTSVCMRWFLFIMTLVLVKQHSQPSASTHFLSKCVCLEHSGKHWAPNWTSRNRHLAHAVALSYDCHSKHPVIAVLRT